MNSTVMEEHCMTLPPKINSQGFQVKGYWEHGVLQFAMPQLQLQMVFIFAVSQACHFVLKHVGLPPFATQLLVRFPSSSSSLLRRFFFLFFFFFFA